MKNAFEEHSPRLGRLSPHGSFHWATPGPQGHGYGDPDPSLYFQQARKKRELLVRVSHTRAVFATRVADCTITGGELTGTEPVCKACQSNSRWSRLHQGTNASRYRSGLQGTEKSQKIGYGSLRAPEQARQIAEPQDRLVGPRLGCRG